MRILCCFFTCLLLTGSLAFASDSAKIGTIKNIQGQCVIKRGAETLPAGVGSALMQNDVLQTGGDSSMGVLLRDDTSLSLGEKSEVVLDEFIFDPANDKLGMLATFTKGTAAVLTGKIAKLDPEAARFRTPLASIGIRGTRFAVKVEN